MMKENDPQKALDYAKKEQQKLLQGKVDITDLIITNELKNDPSTYKTKNSVAIVCTYSDLSFMYMLGNRKNASQKSCQCTQSR